MASRSRLSKVTYHSSFRVFQQHPIKLSAVIKSIELLCKHSDNLFTESRTFVQKCRRNMNSEVCIQDKRPLYPQTQFNIWYLEFHYSQFCEVSNFEKLHFVLQSGHFIYQLGPGGSADSSDPPLDPLLNFSLENHCLKRMFAKT